MVVAGSVKLFRCMGKKEEEPEEQKKIDLFVVRPARRCSDRQTVQTDKQANRQTEQTHVTVQTSTASSL